MSSNITCNSAKYSATPNPQAEKKGKSHHGKSPNFYPRYKFKKKAAVQRFKKVKTVIPCLVTCLFKEHIKSN